MQEPQNTNILVVGDYHEAYSLVVCLLKAGHSTVLLTKEREKAQKIIAQHFDDICKFRGEQYHYQLHLIDELDPTTTFFMAIVITDEVLDEKRAIINQLETVYPHNLMIAVNAESIALSALQQNSICPQRILVANWSAPVHTTYFLELVTNHQNDISLAKNLDEYAKKYWNKDPYIISGEQGIRSQMLTAMVREAFFLVQNGYATIADIDRACRNDPGYYLPFVGNFRYMDLMGTSAYGMVMKDLNPELSNEQEMPDFFKAILAQRKTAGENAGMYNLTKEQQQLEEERFREFSYEIQAIIEKYPSL